MPSADEDLKRRMVARFGDIGTQGPIEYLEKRGYKLTRDSFWIPPVGITNIGQMERDEFECLMYLMHEWDFGGLETA
jgi:hypothetical protein